MTGAKLYFDALMCFFWVTAYALVLIGTIKYKYPMISPITQIFFGTNEIAVLVFFLRESVAFNYAVAAYLCWALLEIAIFAAILRTDYYNKKYILPHLMVIAVGSAFLYYLIAVRGMMLFVCYGNAFLGVLFWFLFVQKKEYPLKPIPLLAFVCKFLADLAAIPVYFNYGNLLIRVICVGLPCLDLLFLVLWLIRRKQSVSH